MIPSFIRIGRKKLSNTILKKSNIPSAKQPTVTEYLILTLLAALPLYTYGLRGKKLLFALFLFCVISASGDEFHQSFIPGRSPQITDVLVDSIGILTGCGITYLVLRNRPSDTASSKKRNTQKG